MRAAVFDATFDLKLKDLPRAAPGPDAVEVEVGAVGLCAGDLYIYLGKNPYVTYPRVGGRYWYITPVMRFSAAVGLIETL